MKTLLTTLVVALAGSAAMANNVCYNASNYSTPEEFYQAQEALNAFIAAGGSCAINTTTFTYTTEYDSDGNYAGYDIDSDTAGDSADNIATYSYSFIVENSTNVYGNEDGSRRRVQRVTSHNVFGVMD